MPQNTVHATAEAHVKAGIRLYKQGNDRGAIKEYQSALRIEPEFAEAYGNWGDLLCVGARYPAAVRCYLKAIRTDPNAVDYDKWIRALDHLSPDRTQRVADTLAELALKDPKYKIVFGKWAEGLVACRRSLEADDKFEQALALDADYGEANRHWGDSLFQRAEYSRAVEKYLAAQAVSSDSFDYSRWQKALEQLGKDEKARAKEEFRKIATKRHEDSLYSEWGQALTALEDYDEAHEVFRLGGAINAQDVAIFKGQGDAYYLAHRYEKALDQYYEVIRITLLKTDYKPDPRIDYERWVKALEAVSSQVRSDIIEKVERLDSPRLSDVYRHWGDALYKLGKCKGATDQYERGAECNPSDPDILNKWGLALVKLGSGGDASEKYELAIKHRAAFAEAYNNWGNLRDEEGKHAEAIEKYLAAMAINPDAVDGVRWVNALAKLKVEEQHEIIDRAWQQAKGKPASAKFYAAWGAALNANDCKAAIVQYRRAAALDPASTNTYLGWADALALLGAWQESVETYLKVLNGYVDALPLDDLYQPLLDLYQKFILVHDYLEEDEKERVRKKVELIAAGNSNGVQVYYQWGNALYLLGRLDDAVEMYNRALKLDKYHANSVFNCGVVFQVQKRYVEALEKYQRAIEINPNEFSYYVGWANTLLDMKNYEGAIDKYEQATKLQGSGDTYVRWGLALCRAKDFDGALEKSRQASAIEQSAYVYFAWGNVLAGAGCYDEAYEKFEAAIKAEPDSLYATYARQNTGEYLFRQGQYAAGRRAWKEARRAYEVTQQLALDFRDPSYFYYYGSMIQTIFGELDEAEKIYLKALELDRNHLGTLISLTGLFIEKENQTFGSNDVQSYWKARQYCQKAYRILNRAHRELDSSAHLQLGELLLALDNYMTADERKEARDSLLKALAKDPTSADIPTNLGVLCAREQDFKKAIQYFSDALKLNPRDLNVWSNLAEAYLRAAFEEKADPGLKETAEKEFNLILEIAPNHVESIIGLGEVQKAMGEVAKDEDYYYRAIDLFLQGIRIANSDVGSKKLKKKELAAAYYSIGYSKVKLYEAAKPVRGHRLLHEARDYFTMSFDKDPENYKAKRAVEKLDKMLTFSSSGLVDTFGPWLIFLAAMVIFFITQTIVVSKPKPFEQLEAGYYVLLSFGSLMFAIAGLYLPQLLKLKVAGIELEKNAVDQIATPGSLKISK